MDKFTEKQFFENETRKEIYRMVSCLFPTKQIRMVGFTLLGASALNVRPDLWEIIMADGSLHQAATLSEGISKVRTRGIGQQIDAVREARTRCGPGFVDVWDAHEYALVALRNKVVAEC